MDKLPGEVIDIIVSFLDRDLLPNFARISSKWKRSVERRTLRELIITASDKDMAYFANIVLPARRRAYVRKLYFRPFVMDQGRWTSPGETAEHASKVFTSNLHRVFELLADGDADVEGRGISLDILWENIDGFTRADRESRLLPRFGLVDRGRHLPMLRGISSLAFRLDVIERHVDPCAVIDLVKRLPCLKRLVIDTGNMHTTGIMLQGKGKLAEFTKQRMVGWNDLAKTLAQANFLADSQCLEVSLSQERYCPSDTPPIGNPWLHDYNKNLLYDPLSAAMRTWSYNLVSLELYGRFDPSLFWPSSFEHTTMPDNPWPRLKNLQVMLKPETHKGEWHFTPRPGSEYWNKPNNDTLQPLFKSWANGLGSMPVLEYASIKFEVMFERACFDHRGYLWLTGVPRDWMVIYQAPSKGCPWESTSLASKLTPSLYFVQLRGWRPSRSTMKKLRALGKDRSPSGETIEYEGIYEDLKEDYIRWDQDWAPPPDGQPLALPPYALFALTHSKKVRYTKLSSTT